MSVEPGTFAALFGVLYVGHQVADHWIQTTPQASTKKHPGNAGRLGCGMHVTTYTATLVAFLLAGSWVFGLALNPAATVVGMAVTTVTHYLIDRGQNLVKAAALIGKDVFYRFGQPREGYSSLDRRRYDDNPTLGTGAYALDQSAHLFFLAVTAAIIAGGAA